MTLCSVATMMQLRKRVPKRGRAILSVSLRSTFWIVDTARSLPSILPRRSPAKSHPHQFQQFTLLSFGSHLDTSECQALRPYPSTIVPTLSSAGPREVWQKMVGSRDAANIVSSTSKLFASASVASEDYAPFSPRSILSIERDRPAQSSSVDSQSFSLV